jgi:hypothetical protein
MVSIPSILPQKKSFKEAKEIGESAKNEKGTSL